MYTYLYLYTKRLLRLKRRWSRIQLRVANIESQLQATVFYIRDRSTVDRWIDIYSGRWVVYVYVYKAVAAAEKEMGAYTAAVANIESQLQAMVFYIRREINSTQMDR